MADAPEPGGSAGKRLTGGELSREVSNLMVQLHQQHFGRGPSAAKTFLIDGMILCVLTDPFTTVEKTLIRAGEEGRVRDTRQAHQQALAKEFTEKIEKVTGRKVMSFVSTVGFDPDVAVELFALEPFDRLVEGDQASGASR